MKLQVRQGVFESNSSSTHTLSICTREEFDQWKAGKLFYNYYTDEFRSMGDLALEVTDADVREYYERTKQEFYKEFGDLTQAEVSKLKDRLIAERLEDADMEDFQTYDSWSDGELESYERSYTTKSGDEIVIFGQYGYC